MPTTRKRKQRPRECGQRIAADNQKLSLAKSIAEISGKQFQQTRNRFSGAFDDPDRACGSAESGREKKRQERIDYLA